MTKLGNLIRYSPELLEDQLLVYAGREIHSIRHIDFDREQVTLALDSVGLYSRHACEFSLEALYKEVTDLGAIWVPDTTGIPCYITGVLWQPD